MKQRIATFLLPAIFLILPPGRATAEILPNGEDPQQQPFDFPVQSVVQSTCPILWYRRAGGDSEIDRLEALGYDLTVVDAAPALAIANLVNYGALVIAYTGPGFLAGRQADIQAFVDQGGGVFIHQPNHAGVLDYTPLGFEVEIADPVWCAAFSYNATIVQGTHPVTQGLTDADLSGAFDDVTSLGPAFTVLATNPDCVDPALAVGTAGSGRVAFDTGNGNELSVDPGTEAYWDQLFDWLCTPGPISVAASSWGSVKAGYR